MAEQKNLSNQQIAAAVVQMDIHCDKLLFDLETKAYWRFDGFIWNPYSKEELHDVITEWCWKNDPTNRLTVGKMDDIANQLKMYLGDGKKYKGVNGKIFGNKVDEIEEKGISFSDKILLLDTLELVDHKPTLDRLAFVHMDFPYSDLSEAKSPLFDAYIKTTCTDKEGNFNQGMHDQLQEVAGWILSNERAETAVILQGEGRNGKSPFLDLLRAMVGKNRCSAISLDTLSKDRFALPHLIGVKLNAKSEDESKGVNLALLKELISGEPMEARRLYEPSFTMTPRCKLIFASNNPPQMAGLDFATKERIFIVKFEHTMQKQDYIRNLGKRMCREELPAFIRWAMVGMERIKRLNCVFTETVQSREAMCEMEEANNSVIDYLRNHWMKDGDFTTPSTEIYESYLETCKHHDARKSMSKFKFGRHAVQELGESFIGSANGKNERCYHARRIDGNDKLANIVPKDEKLPEF